MNLYKISQATNRGWDTFDSAVVAAKSEQLARETTPDGNVWNSAKYTWASSPDKVTVEFIGIAMEGTKAGVIVASFNAG